ncbi:MAG: STAS domain-containing protein [Verrucomicrobiota bacterium]
MFTTKVDSGFLELVVEVDSLDASNAAEMKSSLKELDLQGAERVVLDLQAVNFIDSSGIGALLSFYKQMNQQVVLRKPTATVLSVLELLRLHRVFEIEAD